MADLISPEQLAHAINDSWTLGAEFTDRDGTRVKEELRAAGISPDIQPVVRAAHEYVAKRWAPHHVSLAVFAMGFHVGAVAVGRAKEASDASR